MINHLRTLLLNELPSPLSAMEQYIEPTFSPCRLGAEAAALRSHLILPVWPREYRNFVATLLAGVAHDSPDFSIIDRIDHRSTIDFTVNQVPTLTNAITIIKGIGAAPVNLVGTYQSNPAAGIFNAKWLLTGTPASTVTVQDLRTLVSRALSISFTQDTTGLYLLDPLNGLNFQLVGVSSVPAFQATVVATNSMQYDIASALSRIVGNPTATSIFNLPDATGTLGYLGGVFRNSYRKDLALAAILIAYAYSLSR